MAEATLSGFIATHLAVILYKRKECLLSILDIVAGIADPGPHNSRNTYFIRKGAGEEFEDILFGISPLRPYN